MNNPIEKDFLQRLVMYENWLIHSGNGAPVNELASRLREYRELYEAAGALNKRATAAYNRMREILIPEAFEREGISTITLKDGSRVTVSSRVFAGIKEGMKELAMGWLRKHGYKDIVTETINSSTLSALCKSLGEENKELPQDLFNVYSKQQASLTQGRSK